MLYENKWTKYIKYLFIFVYNSSNKYVRYFGGLSVSSCMRGGSEDFSMYQRCLCCTQDKQHHGNSCIDEEVSQLQYCGYLDWFCIMML